MHIVRTDGSVSSAGDAVIELMGMSLRTLPAAWLARLLPMVRRRIQRDYDRMAARRGELSAKVPDTAEVVDPPRLLREGT